MTQQNDDSPEEIERQRRNTIAMGAIACEDCGRTFATGKDEIEHKCSAK